jgi:hypothetical protein
MVIVFTVSCYKWTNVIHQKSVINIFCFKSGNRHFVCNAIILQSQKNIKKSNTDVDNLLT